MTIRLHPEAEIELEHALEWYHEIDPNLPLALLHEYRVVTQHLIKSPRIYHHRPNGYRRANLHRFPFYLPFIIHNNEIVILAFAHQSRMPNYWARREP